MTIRRFVLPVWLLIPLWVSFCAPCQGQSARMRVRGTVSDRSSCAALEGVNIRVEGSHRGTTTGASGQFSLVLYSIPAYITISHVGFQTQKFYIDDPATTLKVFMEPAAQLLPEVEIMAKTLPATFFKDNLWAVTDYEVDSGLVYLLISRMRLSNSELLCKNLNGDTVARSGILPFIPTGLFSDCIGTVHLLGRDSAYQVFLADRGIGLAYPVILSKFAAVLERCAASSPSMLYLRESSPDGLTVNFRAVDRLTGTSRHVQSAADEERLKMLRRSPMDLYFLMLDTIPDNFSDAVYMHWLKRIFYPPNHSTLFRIRDLLCIFNTTDGTVGIFTTEGDMTARLKLLTDRNMAGKWTGEIIYDEPMGKVYTSFIHNGLVSLARIDLNTGDLHPTLNIIHEFPQKIKINQGFVFYLYNVPGPNDNQHLFIQKL